MTRETVPVKRVKIKVPITSLERIQFEAESAANESTLEHENAADPHPQYTTDAEVLALIPPTNFTQFYLWGA